MHKICLIFTVCFLCIHITGCEKPPDIKTDVKPTVFTDALGNEIVLYKTPSRVATLVGGFADIWMLAGGVVCAAPDDAWEEFNLPLEDAVNLGGAHSPSLEALIASEPDFVIASASVASNVELAAVLKNIGIPSAFFDVDSFEDYLAMLDICTSITGRKDLYKENGIRLKTQIDAIKSELFEADIPEKERTVLLLRASSGSVKTKRSSDTVLGEMLRSLGCINIADNEKYTPETLNIESILQEDPHHIFVVIMGNDSEKAMQNLRNMLQENPAWDTLAAIRENRLHIMDKELFHIKPNEKWAEAYAKLAEIFKNE